MSQIDHEDPTSAVAVRMLAMGGILDRSDLAPFRTLLLDHPNICQQPSSNAMPCVQAGLLPA